MKKNNEQEKKPFFAGFLENQIGNEESSTIQGGGKIITRVGSDTDAEWPSGYTYHVSSVAIFPERKRYYGGSRRYFSGDTNDISCRFFPG
ncbi:hypothetical protein [Flavobacterium cerinum]|uniref:Uncharacterized protein n=1 Tax=Flavobacterium cerinum TaxID=2502784 RepID=A0ABY5IPX6_9FLAO|nr:hypothetical protein [Flavobacterium cerinum]UUC44336.1 hypothetical protein NOX80_11905 [Flavobacterium cerinum]